jgi:hydrogenase maturation factor HypE
VQAKLEDEIKALRDTVDLQEYEHRMAESKYQKDLKKRIEEEVEDTTKQNEEIAQRWSIVTALEVPQELAKQIEAQHQVFWSTFCHMCIFD